MYDEFEVTIYCIISAIFSALVVCCISCVINDSSWERAAVKHNAAEYNRETAKFQWKENLNNE